MSLSAVLKHVVPVAAVLVMLPVSAHAQENRLFEAEDSSYSFEYPQGFELAHEFADGTGDVTGVTASTPENGDVSVTFLGPWDAGNLPEASEQNKQAIVDEFTKSIAVTPKITLQSSQLTEMLGQPAVDMVFLNKTSLIMGKGTPAINRYVVTIIDGKAYNFRCAYREDKADEFASACDTAVETVKLQSEDAQDDAVSDAPARADEPTEAAGCTKLGFNQRVMQVVELSSGLMMKDQSEATIEKLQKAQQEMAAVQARASDTPSEQDCTDMDAVVKSLK